MSIDSDSRALQFHFIIKLRIIDKGASDVWCRLHKILSFGSQDPQTYRYAFFLLLEVEESVTNNYIFRVVIPRSARVFGEVETRL